MSFLSFIIHDTQQIEKRDRIYRPATMLEKTMTFVILTVWVILILFAIISFVNPSWLMRISDPGRLTEAMTYKNKADELMTRGRYSEAIEIYMESLKIKPGFVDAEVNIGIAFSKMGDYNRAIQILNKALENNVRFPDVLYINLAEIYEEKGEVAKAIGYYYKALEYSSEPFKIYYKLGELYHERDKPDSMILVLNNALKNKLDLESDYLSMLKFAHADFKDKEEILKEITNYFDPEKLTNEAAKYDAGIYARIEATKIELSEVHYLLGLALIKKGNYYGGVVEFRNAVELWEGNTKAQRKIEELVF